MIGLDTNVLVRHLTQDDPVQSPLASAFIEQNLSADTPGVIGHLVLAELAWVLARAYGYTREQVADALHAILTCREFRVETPDEAILALDDYRKGSADFADCLIGRHHRRLGASCTASFDRKAAQSPLFRLLG